MDPSEIVVERSSFPQDFIFGAATSAYQVERAWNADGKDSIADGQNGGVAIDHYNMFEEDAALMKKVGLNSYRFSISWSRILPGGKLCGGISKEGIKYYNDLINALLAKDIQPCATIFHWDVPQCLEHEYRGFLDRQIVDHFCKFADICFREFGDRVKCWITLNEPRSFTYCGYVIARFPPRRGYILATSLERVLRSSILHHRSAITIRPRTSSTVRMTRDLDGMARYLPYDTSSERDPIAEIVDMAYNLPYDTSAEGDEVRELIAQAYNLPYSPSSEGYANDGAMAYDYFNRTSFEGYPVGEGYTSSEGRSVREVSEPHNLPSRTSSKAERVRVSSMEQNLHHLTSSKGDRVRISSMTHVPRLNFSKGDPGTEPYIVAHNLILAHANAVDIYRTKYQGTQGGKIGMTNVATWYEPYSDKKEDTEASSRALQFMLGWFIEPMVTGEYPPAMRENVKERLPKFTDDQEKLVKGSYDFLGINYYTAYYATDSKIVGPPNYVTDQQVQPLTERNGIPIGRKGGSDWLYIVPWGIFNLMSYAKETYQDPIIYITENGVDEKNNKGKNIASCLSDEIRIKYHNDHLWNLKMAMVQKNVRVKGYYAWSLFDNFEWCEGYTVRFGIFLVDFENGRLTRFPKSSALWWMQFLDKNQIKNQAQETEEGRQGSVKRLRIAA